jgi:hypothetical protein
MERLRSIRVELNRAESDVSLVRRVAQGRLDIVGHEVDRRQGTPGATGHGTPDGGPADDPAGERAAEGGGEAASPYAGVPGPTTGPAGLLFDMPDILSDGAGPGSRGRMVEVEEPGPLALALMDQLDAAASPGRLSGLDDLDRPALGDLFESLRGVEVELSSARRRLHDRIDTIQDEIARRYRDGEATIDSLLHEA